MNNIIELLPPKLSLLYIGFKNNYLNNKELIYFIDKNWNNFNCESKILIDININIENKEYILNILKNQIQENEFEILRTWQLIYLIDIYNKNEDIHNKLLKIELLWSKFDYIESWKDFIYYLPNSKSNNENDLYEIFINFINKEKQELLK